MKYAEILEVAQHLTDLLDEQVPDGPHYWRPWYLEGQEFPLSVDDYQWLRSKLGTLVATLEEIQEAEEELAEA